MADGDVVFVTGYPVMRARSVCAELLRSDERCLVYLLVRPGGSQSAREALADPVGEDRERIKLIEGSASAIDFGLSGGELESLGRDVTHIHHCAEVTNPGAERKTAERVNVGAAQEALEFARCCGKLRCLVFHSTVHVAGDRSGIVREDELEAGQSFRNVIEETKARAEKLMRSAMASMPIAVVRPATISCDATTGAVDRPDGMYFLVLLALTSSPEWPLRLPGRGEGPLNLVPSDWVARAASAIGRDPRAPGRTFHLVDPRPAAARAVFDLVARASGTRASRGSVPANLARALLRAPGLDRIARTPRAFLDTLLTLTTPVTYDARNADELLNSLGIPACPPFESYVDKLVEHVRKRIPDRGAARKDAPMEIDEPPA
ncbi:MAG TPA: SDR family oxidoreductase [Polyangiaceae bacterium]|nr:SDR family oxidoreductase [Polyangiaceae bacterium]